jgi:hypothetical protein
VIGSYVIKLLLQQRKPEFAGSTLAGILSGYYAFYLAIVIPLYAMFIFTFFLAFATFDDEIDFEPLLMMALKYGAILHLLGSLYFMYVNVRHAFLLEDYYTDAKTIANDGDSCDCNDTEVATDDKPKITKHDVILVNSVFPKLTVVTLGILMFITLYDVFIDS